MVATKTIVIAGIIIAICVTALVVGIVLGTRDRKCSGDASVPVDVTPQYTLNNSVYTLMVSWAIPDEDKDCAVSYRVIYEYEQNGVQENNTVEVTDLDDISITLFSLQPCVEVTVHIWPKNEDGDISSDHFMDNYTIPLESINAPTNIAFSGDGDLEVSWTRPSNAGECNVAYQVIVTTDGTAASPEEVNTASHSIPDNSFCIKAGVSITASYEDLTSPSVFQEYTIPAVSNVDMVRSTDDSQVLVSWDALPKPQCSVQYRIIPTIAGETSDPIETTSTEYNFAFNYCVDMQFVITAFVDEFESQSAKEIFRGEPTEIGAVTNVQLVERIITWEAPSRYTACSLTYVLSASPDGAITQDYTSTVTQYALADIPYCFTLHDIVLRADYNDVVGLSTEFISFTQDAEIQNLQITTVDDKYVVNWDPHPKEEQCNIQYQVVYDLTGEEEDDSEFNTLITESEHSFDKLYCIAGTFYVTAVGDGQSSETAEIQLLEAQTVTITSLAAENGQVSWDPVEPLSRCTIEYQISYITDSSTVSTTTTVVGNSFELPADSYCFKYDITITPVVSGEPGSPASASDLSDNQVNNFDLTIVDGRSVARWDPHRKEVECGIHYQVVYALEGDEEDDSEFDLPLIVSEYSFDIVYCIAGIFSVTAVANNDETSAALVVDLLETPTVTITNLVANNGEVSWDEIVPGGRCTIQYQVSYITDTNTEPVTITTNGNNFEVPTASYCFTYNITVTPIVSGILAQSSAPATDNFNNQVQSLEVIIVAGQYAATWDAHLKEEQCNIYYRVVYTLEGDDIVFDNSVTESEYAFNIVYCVAGTFSVIAVSDNDFESGTSIIDLDAENQPAVITDISANNGQVNWNEIVPVGRCTIGYEVTYIADTNRAPVTQTIQANSFIVPSEDYCFRYDVTVVPIVSGESGPSNSATDSTDDRVNIVQVGTASDDDDMYFASWDPHPKEGQCNIQYEVVYTLEGDNENSTPAFEDVTPDAEITFPKVYCTGGTLSITATGDNDVRSASTVEDLPEEYPVIIPSVTDQSVTDGEVTWQGLAAIGRCTIMYIVSYTTDLIDTPIEIAAVDNTATIPSTDYCFTYNIDITPYIEIDTENKVFGISAYVIPDNAVEDLLVETSSDDINVYIATWAQHPKEVECGLEYEIAYTLDGEDGNVFSDQIPRLTHTFNKVYCIAGTFSVTAVGNDVKGTASDFPLDLEYPDPIPGVTDPESTSELITWTELAPIGRCTINYIVSYTTDMSNTLLEISREDGTATIPSNQFCFEYYATITPFIARGTTNEISGPPVDASFSDVDIELEFNGAPANNEVSVTWTTHNKIQQCEISYSATYSLGGDPKELTDDMAIFDIAYCQSGTITVSATTNIPAITLAGSHTHNEISPVAIEEVQNIVAVPPADGDTFITLRWDPPPYVGGCNLIYTVTVDAPSDPDYDDGCDAINTRLCELEESCDTMNINIRTEYVDDLAVFGTTPHVYNCVAEPNVIHT